jgi:hypothetical protein
MLLSCPRHFRLPTSTGEFQRAPALLKAPIGLGFRPAGFLIAKRRWSGSPNGTSSTICSDTRNSHRTGVTQVTLEAKLQFRALARCASPLSTMTRSHVKQCKFAIPGGGSARLAVSRYTFKHCQSAEYQANNLHASDLRPHPTFVETTLPRNGRLVKGGKYAADNLSRPAPRPRRTCSQSATVANAIVFLALGSL